MMLRVICALVIPLALLARPVASFSADIFRWVDEKGVVHFTDNLHNIPEKQRGAVKTIKASQSPLPLQAPVPIVTDKTSIPIQRKGQIVIVQATMNEKASANFVVDTGATYTMISRATAKALDIDLEKKLPTIPLQTANGVIQAPLVNLDSIEVGGMQVKNLVAAIHDVFPDATIAGLLGLNYLSNFRMDIDSQNGFLHLEKK